MLERNECSYIMTATTENKIKFFFSYMSITVKNRDASLEYSISLLELVTKDPSKNMLRCPYVRTTAELLYPSAFSFKLGSLPTARL